MTTIRNFSLATLLFTLLFAAACGETTVIIDETGGGKPAANNGGGGGGNTTPGDRDGDGIKDDVDACPDKVGVASSDPTKHGCPPVVVTPSDRDGDGVLDNVDQCPDQPGPATNNGCPIVTGECPKGTRKVDGTCTTYWGVQALFVSGDSRYGYVDHGAGAIEQDITLTTPTWMNRPIGESIWGWGPVWGSNRVTITACKDRDGLTAPVYYKLVSTGIADRPTARINYCTTDGAPAQGSTLQAIANAVAEAMFAETGDKAAAAAVRQEFMANETFAIQPTTK